jgi:threonine/homoserine/homoserine lactone efflux protein
MLEMFISAYLLGIAVAIPPGSVTIEISRRAITRGWRAALTFNAGSLSADLLYAILVYIGLGPLVERSEAFRLGLWIIGGAWLLFLGWEALRATIDLHKVNEAAETETFRRGYLSGVGITLLNPLTVLGWIGLAGGFFAAWHGDWGSLAAWGWLAVLAMMLGVTTWTLFLIGFLSSIRQFIPPLAMRAFSVGAGLFLIGIGLRSWWLAAGVLG